MQPKSLKELVNALRKEEAEKAYNLGYSAGRNAEKDTAKRALNYMSRSHDSVRKVMQEEYDKLKEDFDKSARTVRRYRKKYGRL